ncbi:aminoacyl-tRNA hydrolase [Patescibacteria group bacterium]|nr:aminoacyl-tRNA hydrolase [Patescibacteria group bacterium]MDT8347342.1 aminoacyl-tRNA hydrolase [Flavobacteriaceae bacterium]
MILIAGLGNPGSKYEKTRHNVGFMVLDHLAKNFDVDFKEDKKNKALIAEHTTTFEGKTRLLLVKPQTFMNNSGETIARLVNFYKLHPEDQVWIIHDDLDIEIGTLRVRINGSSAGQKGVQSVIDKLGTDKFIRFRIGIKPSSKQLKPAEEFVLEKFNPQEKEIIKDKIKETSLLIVRAIDKGIEKTTL